MGNSIPDRSRSAFAGPVIGIACAVFYATRRIQLPAPVGPASATTALAMILGSLAIAAIASDSLRDGLPVLVVGAGLAGFAWLYRSTLVAIVACAHLLAAFTIILTDSARTTDLATIGAGLVSCVGGIAGVLLLDATSPVDE